jgi:hypothetical protein
MGTRLARRLTLFIPLVAAVCHALGQAGHPAQDSVDEVIGFWRGHSTCAVKSSPCRDEINVYRISRIANQSSQVSVLGSKIVDGNTIVMGSGDWKYDPKRHALQSLDASASS